MLRWRNRVRSTCERWCRGWSERSTSPPGRSAPPSSATRTSFRSTPKDGRWKHAGERWTDWCAGFHAGMMWLIAQRTGDPWWRRTAEHYSRLLEHRQHDRNVHDLGFIFLNTYLPWYRLTGDERLRQVLITAGRTLALRFNPQGAIPPLVRGAGEPVHRHHDERAADLLRRARDRRPRLCTTWRSPIAAPPSGPWSVPTARRPTRGSSTPRPAQFLRQVDPSGPARRFDLGARAWPGRCTGSARCSLTPATRPICEVAQRNADCFLARCPDGLVPPWDFDVPDGPDRIDDSSAAAIAASGLWNLAELTAPSDPACAKRYRDATLTILDSALHRPIPGLVHTRLGRGPETRRLSFPQETGRRRVGDVGRFFLPRSRRQGLARKS